MRINTLEVETAIQERKPYREKSHSTNPIYPTTLKSSPSFQYLEPEDKNEKE